GLFRSSFCLVPNTIHCRPRTTTGIGLCEAPDLDRRTAGPFCRLISTAMVSKATGENGCGKLPISPFVFGLYSSAKSPASLRSPMIYKSSARGPYVRFVRAPPAGEARGSVGGAAGVGGGAGTSVLSAFERVAGGRALRRVGGEPVREVLCGQVRATVADAGDLLSFVADRVFRGHRGGARDRLAAGGLAGAAAFCGHFAGRVHAGSLDDLAHAAADRSGHASRSVRLGAGRAGRSRAAERPADRHRCDDAGGERGDALNRSARHGRELRGVSARIGEGLGHRDTAARRL